MALPQLRRWIPRGAACVGVIAAVTVGIGGRGSHLDAPINPVPLEITTTTPTPERVVDAAIAPITTTTALPPPTTAAPVPPTSRVTTPPTTAAPRAVASSQAASIQERGEAALALLDYPWQALGYTIRFQGGVTGVLGETNSSTHVVTIFVREGQSPIAIARTLAHELGHALDFSLTTVAEARQYLAIRGLPYAVADWYPTCDGCTDFGSPAGDFAETFAYYLLGPGDFRSLIGAEPTADQLAQLADIFAPH